MESCCPRLQRLKLHPLPDLVSVLKLSKHLSSLALVLPALAFDCALSSHDMPCVLYIDYDKRSTLHILTLSPFNVTIDVTENSSSSCGQCKIWSIISRGMRYE